MLHLKFSLGEKLGILKKLDEEILDFIEEETDISWEIKQADEFKERIYAATIDIDKCCEYACELNPPTDVTGTRSSRTYAHGAQVKLPKLVFRNFCGDITCWTTFWDSFESAIDQKSGLSEIDKFNYLKSLLEKSAA